MNLHVSNSKPETCFRSKLSNQVGSMWKKMLSHLMFVEQYCQITSS
jgi:hypothetical protein